MNFIRRVGRSISMGTSSVLSTAEDVDDSSPPPLPPRKEGHLYALLLRRVEQNCHVLRFESGRHYERYLSSHSSSTLNGRATELRIPGEWLAAADAADAAAADHVHHVSVVATTSPQATCAVVVVGFQRHLTTLSHSSLVEISKVVGEYYSGFFDVMVHKMSSDVRQLAAISPDDRHSFPTLLNNPGSELLLASLSFAHTALTLLPPETDFTDIVQFEKIETAGDSLLDFIHDGHPKNFGAIMSLESLTSIRKILSIIHFTLTTYSDMPLIPTPVLQAFGEYFVETNSSSTTSGEALVKSSGKRRASSFDGVKSSFVKGSGSAVTAGSVVLSSSRPNSVLLTRPLKRPLSTTNPASMTLLMIPARDRDALLLVVSLFSRMLLTVEPKTYSFLMPLVAMFYEAVVDHKQHNNTPLFVAGLIREFRTLARAEASRASLMIRRTRGTTLLSSEGDSEDGSDGEKNNKRKLLQCVGCWSIDKQRDARHYSNRLLDLVSASGEGNDAADEAVFEWGQQRRQQGGEKEKSPSNAQKSKSQNESDMHTSQTSNMIVTSLNLVFQRAPVIPNYVWELLKRCHPYFGNDTVSYSHITKSIVRDMLPDASIEILRHLHRLQGLFENEKENAWLLDTLSTLIAPSDIHAVFHSDLILQVFDSCSDLTSEVRRASDVKLSFASTFGELHAMCT